MLVEQEETINNIDKKLDIVDANNAKASKIVKSMSSMWGQFKNIIFNVKPEAPVTSVPKSSNPADKMPVLKQYNQSDGEWAIVH